MNRSFLFLTAALTLSCGSSTVYLSHDEYERLPHDYRQEIFDAENDLVIARNRKDDATDRREVARRTIHDLEERWERTTKRLSASGQGAKVGRAQKVFDTHIAYATALVDVAAAGITRGEMETRVSRAHLDLVRQRQLARIGRAPVSSLDPLEATVKSLEEKLKTAVAAEVEQRTRVQAQLNAWKVAQDEYSSSSGDYDTGVWGE